MIQHTNAVKAKFQEITPVASKVYISQAPRDSAGKLPATPFVVLHPVDGIDEQTSFTGPKLTQNPRWIAHMVGTSYEQVAALTKLAKDKFVVAGRGITLTVSGETCQPVWWESPTPVQVDNDVKPPVIYAVAELGFRTDTFV